MNRSRFMSLQRAVVAMLCVATGWIECEGLSASISKRPIRTRTTTTTLQATAASSWFSATKMDASSRTLEQRKAVLLQLGASLDRGQAYNPTSGDYYKDRMDVAVSRIDDFLEQHASNIPTLLEQISGEWELVLSTVPHGIFRSSPFFLAIQEAYETYAEEKEAFGIRKADLFFKLHELQTCSWGVSKIGRVAQHITVDNDSGMKTTGYLYSEFDTSIFSLTVIPILGWFKLLPTFGGCVVTAATCELQDGGVLQMKVDYTTARPVPGLQGLGDWIWNVKVPVGAIWKLLPWNKGRDALCKVFMRYVDDDFRIVQDVSGDYFVYTRPVIPRSLDLAEE
jgi:uncharacterized membrane protein YgdD (TMEM256/DUF423 family)